MEPTKTKQVSYAYPTSSIAKANSCYNIGCWVVEIGEGFYLPSPKEIISVHSLEREAIDAAYLLNIPWSRCWLNLALSKTSISTIATNQFPNKKTAIKYCRRIVKETNKRHEVQLTVAHKANGPSSPCYTVILSR